jgi:hypothetical protein
MMPSSSYAVKSTILYYNVQLRLQARKPLSTESLGFSEQARCCSVDSDAELSQVRLGELDLLRELLVRIRYVVEGKDAEAEAEE